MCNLCKPPTLNTVETNKVDWHFVLATIQEDYATALGSYCVDAALMTKVNSHVLKEMH